MFQYPNYKDNIINISATLTEYLGVSTKYPELSILKKELQKDYKNVVFIILDGFGYYVMKNHLDKENILVKNCLKKITSVFPSTTTNATTTLMSCNYPSEHCWLGWSLYFEEIKNCVDIFLNKISFTKHFLNSSFTTDRLPYDAFYNHKTNNIDVYTVFPRFVKKGISSNNYYFSSNEQMFEAINSILKLDNKKFIYSYTGEPDKTMHEFGASSNEAKQVIEDLSLKISRLVNNDTLVIVTADHGQIDVEEYIELYKDYELMECLSRPLSIEVRATSFKVRNNRLEDFINIFNKKYAKDFELLKVDDLLQQGVFGDISEKAKQFLGDYISVPIGKKAFTFHEEMPLFKGHHTGLSKEEIYVPLIMIGNK